MEACESVHKYFIELVDGDLCGRIKLIDKINLNSMFSVQKKYFINMGSIELHNIKENILECLLIIYNEVHRPPVSTEDMIQAEVKAATSDKKIIKGKRGNEALTYSSMIGNSSNSTLISNTQQLSKKAKTERHGTNDFAEEGQSAKPIVSKQPSTPLSELKELAIRLVSQISSSSSEMSNITCEGLNDINSKQENKATPPPENTKYCSVCDSPNNQTRSLCWRCANTL
jgi:hypothetical protein